MGDLMTINLNFKKATILLYIVVSFFSVVNDLANAELIWFFFTVKFLIGPEMVLGILCISYM